MTDTPISTESSKPPLTPPMRRALSWWGQIIVLLVVFIAGSVVGAMVAAKVIHSQMEYYRHHAEASPQDILPRLQRRLTLTDDQTEKVREIISRRHPVMIESRRREAQTMLNEFRSMEGEIGKVLDANQQTLWHDIATSVRNRFLPPAPGGSTP